MADHGDVGKEDPSAGLFMMNSVFIYSEVNITQQIPVRSPDSCDFSQKSVFSALHSRVTTLPVLAALCCSTLLLGETIEAAARTL